jgi:hypothetical protein
MPFVPPEIRQQLNLVTSTPALEDVHQAAAAQGLQFDPHTFELSPVPVRKQRPATSKSAPN